MQPRSQPGYTSEGCWRDGWIHASSTMELIQPVLASLYDFIRYLCAHFSHQTTVCASGLPSQCPLQHYRVLTCLYNPLDLLVWRGTARGYLSRKTCLGNWVFADISTTSLVMSRSDA
ncbi:hypothetical protein MJO29_000124 [Puccinia striiformis f. sp. tritici]|nr:hypothetical protein MJO29_000124 [Puccinia striiformis f. sp. tritici]KAI9601620.1 hypothetical protein H4Q26_001452 [Puccinia striiformis f. sp. tritici PST-130]